MYLNQTISPGSQSTATNPTVDYLNFCGKVSRSLGKDWVRVEPQCEAVWEHVNHIPSTAWQQIAVTASKRWETWPRNLYIAITELYNVWTSESQFTREVKPCDYCKGAGTFSASKVIQVKPEMSMRYYYTYRCKGCENWRGLYGDKIALAYPLEIKSAGFEIHLNGSPLESDDASRRSLSKAIASIGTRTNPKLKRPDFIPYKDPTDDGEIPF